MRGRQKHKFHKREVAREGVGGDLIRIGPQTNQLACNTEAVRGHIGELAKLHGIKRKEAGENELEFMMGHTGNSSGQAAAVPRPNPGLQPTKQTSVGIVPDRDSRAGMEEGREKKAKLTIVNRA